MKRRIWIGLIALALAVVAAQCGASTPDTPANTESEPVEEAAPAEQATESEEAEEVVEEVEEVAAEAQEEEAMAEEEETGHSEEAMAEEEEATHEEEAMAEEETEAEVVESEEAEAMVEEEVESCDDPFGGASVRFNPDAWNAETLVRFVGPEIVDAESGVSTNFCKHSVDYGEILSGGPPPDGIPPIDNPNFDSLVDGDAWLADVQPVLSLEVNGDARAYPLAILTRHEIVNDEVGGVPVAATFCPLCNAGIVFNREVDGEVLRFGVSGNLRNSDLIMWDNKSLSWWQQFTGQAIVGDKTGTQLEFMPAQLVSWKDFKERYPKGQVLSTNGRNYGINPYAGYDSTENPFLYLGTPDPRLRATERVLGFFDNENSIAYPLPAIAAAGVVEDTIGDMDVVIFYEPGQVSALDQSTIEDSKEVGSAAMFIPVVDGQALTFSYDNGVITDNETGSEWDVFGQAISGELEGSQMELVLSFTHFWFAWAAFQPDTVVYEG